MGSSQDLQTLRRDICRDVVFEHIATQLLETNLISEEEMRRIEAKVTDPEQTAELLEVLSKKGGAVYADFAKVLEPGYPWLAEIVAKSPQLFNASTPKISRLATGITQEMIKMVQRNYRVADKWTIVAHSLGLSRLITDIRIRVNTYGELNSMCIVYLLQEWMGMRSQEATLGRLIQVLREQEFNDIADELEAKFA